MGAPCWTATEMAYLRAAYPDRPREELQTELKRKWCAIREMARRSGLKRRTAEPRPIGPRTAICAELTTARTMRKISRAALARRIGYDRSALLDWETGRAQPSAWTVVDWAQGLGFDLVLVPRDETVAA